MTQVFRPLSSTQETDMFLSFGVGWPVLPLQPFGEQGDTRSLLATLSLQFFLSNKKK